MIATYLHLESGTRLIMASETFASFIKASREGADLTQDELAEMVGLKKPQISRIENGHQTTTAAMVRKICRATNADLVRGLLLLSIAGEEEDPSTDWIDESYLKARPVQEIRVSGGRLTVSGDTISKATPAEIRFLEAAFSNWVEFVESEKDEDFTPNAKPGLVGNP